MNICLECKTQTRNKKFCNKSCLATYYNRKNPKRKKRPIGPPHDCLICGVEVLTHHRMCETHRNLRKPLEKIVTLGAIKWRLIQARGHKCEIEKCGITEWCGKPAPLQIDHIDGNPTNNDLLNLRLICANCHAQTDTFCGKNIGKNPQRKRSVSPHGWDPTLRR